MLRVLGQNVRTSIPVEKSGSPLPLSTIPTTTSRPYVSRMRSFSQTSMTLVVTCRLLLLLALLRFARAQCPQGWNTVRTDDNSLGLLNLQYLDFMTFDEPRKSALIKSTLNIAQVEIVNLAIYVHIHIISISLYG